METVRWGIIGLGGIANEFAAVFEADRAEIVAAASRSLQKAQDFAEKYNIPKAYGNYGAMLHDPDVDAVYIATPNTYHISVIKQALKQGKHVLCEKAMVVNQKELDEAMALAKENNVVLAEAMTIYHMPLFKKIKEFIDSGELGEVKMVHALFGSLKDPDPTNRFFSKELGGGALLDVGVYALSFVRYFLNSQPTDIQTVANMYSTGVDEQASVIMKNKEEEIGTVSMSFRSKMPKMGVIVCEEGYITVADYPRASQATLTRPDGSTETITAGDTKEGLNYEIQAFTRTLLTGEDETSFNLTKDVTSIMNTLSKEWGMDLSLEQ